MQTEVSTFIVLIFGCTGLYLVHRLQRRSSSDVLRDLAQDFWPKETLNSSRQDNDATFASVAERECTATRFDRLRALALPVLFCLLAVLCLMLQSSKCDLSQLVFSAVFGAALGYVAQRIRFAALEKARKREMEFYLPIVMERVVMAVQAGFDIVAALKRVVELETKSAELNCRNKNWKSDPVTRLLQLVSKLCESGLGFEESLRHVAALNPSFAVRHALIHLALAYKEGGELVMPLMELSDSTQLYYQESVEEDIARMPVKATMPLVMTFAGLIVCFITAPLMQVLNIVSKAMP